MKLQYIDIRPGDDALRRAVSGSVQRGLSAIRPVGRGVDTVALVRPDGGKTLLRSASPRFEVK